MRFTSQENQDKVWLPLNPITEKIWYTNEVSKNMRVLVGSYTENPIAWQISKVENAQPLGIQKLTLYQDFYNQHRDYLERDCDDNIIGMWANYYDSDMVPIDPDIPSPTVSPINNVISTISSSSSSIKVGGSYKTLTINFLNSETKEDVTDKFDNAQFEWNFYIDEVEYKDIICKDVSFNQIKVKLSDDSSSVLGKLLNIKCITFRDDVGYIHSNTIQMEIVE